MSQLHSKFVMLLEEFDQSNPSCRRDKLKKRLVNYFQKRLEFWKPKRANETEVVFSSLLGKGELLEAFMTLKHETEGGSENEMFDTVDEDDCTSPSSAMTHLHSALQLRSTVMDVKDKMPWPPTAEDLNDAAIDCLVPPMLYNYLVLLLVGVENRNFDAYDVEHRISNVSETTHRRVMSIAQDIIYTAHNGHVKTPKHVLLTTFCCSPHD